MLAATKAVGLGYGGVSKVARACGLSRVTISHGIAELSEPAMANERVRRQGAGRPAVELKNPRIIQVLDDLVEPMTRGDPESPLRWTCKSTRILATELSDRKHPVSHAKVAQLLQSMNYSLQGNRKTEEGEDHPDRDAQFQHINRQVKRAMRQGQPVISVDTKKKELVGNYSNSGKEWRPVGEVRKVKGHDFPDPEVPRAYPYGIYDIQHNTGFVNVGTDHDTAAFAVASIRGWWKAEGREIYPKAKRLMITADGGGSNGHRLRLWKLELQRLADETKIAICVCHFPPGTSKWNKVEHRLFSFISSNWRGQPLIDYQTIVQLISHTKTAKGLTVSCRLDRRRYTTGRKVTDQEMATVRIRRSKFHGEWNYEIHPSP
jgi:Rhodopirellula transposase DDE domain